MPASSNSLTALIIEYNIRNLWASVMSLTRSQSLGKGKSLKISKKFKYFLQRTHILHINYKIIPRCTWNLIDGYIVDLEKIIGHPSKLVRDY
jgi:hypothetical protein